MFQHLMVSSLCPDGTLLTKLHPELGFEDDLKELFQTHEVAQCV